MKVKQGTKNTFRAPTPIVPPANLSSKTLMVVVVIMSFLACLTLGFVTLIQEASKTWQNQILEEITIQIKPVNGQNMEEVLLRVKELSLEFDGTISAHIIDKKQTSKLLEPWLGKGIKLDELPVPRLVTVRIDKDNPPNFEEMQDVLTSKISNAYLDDHRAWATHLVNMAQSIVFLGVILLSLVLIATILTVVFATRGAMSVNRDIIEVLHFVGAESSFVAGEFQKHFLLTGFYGGMIGGVLAALLFYVTSIWQGMNRVNGIDQQMTNLFGGFQMGGSGYFGIAIIVVMVAVLTALTTRMTVIRTIRDIDLVYSDPS